MASNWDLIKFFIVSKTTSTPHSVFFSIPLESASQKNGTFSEVKKFVSWDTGFPNPSGVKFSESKTAFIKVDFPTPGGPTTTIFRCSTDFTSFFESFIKLFKTLTVNGEIFSALNKLNMS